MQTLYKIKTTVEFSKGFREEFTINVGAYDIYEAKNIVERYIALQLKNDSHRIVSCDIISEEKYLSAEDYE